MVPKEGIVLHKICKEKRTEKSHTSDPSSWQGPETEQIIDTNSSWLLGRSEILGHFPPDIGV